jgi:hypothetical protein
MRAIGVPGGFQGLRPNPLRGGILHDVRGLTAVLKVSRKPTFRVGWSAIVNKD